MRRILVMFLLLGLIASSVATAEAKEKRKPRRIERTVEGTYGPYPAPFTGCNEPLGPWVCLVVKPRLSEHFFTAKVKDTHGQPVFVAVSNGGNGFMAHFCGETTKPIAFDPNYEVEFYVGLVPTPSFDEDGNPRTGLPCGANVFKTTGTISVTLSNR